MARVTRKSETAKEKGIRAYRLNMVKVLKNDKFEILFEVNGTEVSFIKSELRFRCFNPECSLFRGNAEYPMCYHTYAAQRYILEHQEELK